jgi:protein-disulfide isomerase
MPVRKSTNKATLKRVILNTTLQTIGTKLVYVLLLIAFLVIGYLLGKVEALQKGVGTQALAPTTAPAAQQPQAPVAPDPEQVRKDLKMGHFPAAGNENAKVAIVEFSDFECPFCGRFYSDTLPQLRKDYIDTGKVKLYYRHYPLPFHPKAISLAHIAECANDQGAFWKMHDKIFDNNSTVSNMTDEQFKQWGADLGLDTVKFNNCYDNKTHQKDIDEDNAAGRKVGVSGTPTFYINGKQLVGAQPYAAFKAAIDEALK